MIVMGVLHRPTLTYYIHLKPRSLHEVKITGLEICFETSAQLASLYQSLTKRLYNSIRRVICQRRLRRSHAMSKATRQEISFTRVGRCHLGVGRLGTDII